jgi:tripartite-type tricarboxylate transporter receptor subunit TctC
VDAGAASRRSTQGWLAGGIAEPKLSALGFVRAAIKSAVGRVSRGDHRTRSASREGRLARPRRTTWIGIIYRFPFDLERAFAPIDLISINPQLLLARKTLEPTDLKGLVAWMKANPGKAKFANQNCAARVAGVLLQKATGADFQFVAYQGAAPAMKDLIAGQVDLLMVQTAIALPQMRAGTVKALANLSPQRSATIPDIPTSGDEGVPGFYMRNLTELLHGSERGAHAVRRVGPLQNDRTAQHREKIVRR